MTGTNREVNNKQTLTFECWERGDVPGKSFNSQRYQELRIKAQEIVGKFVLNFRNTTEYQARWKVFAKSMLVFYRTPTWQFIIFLESFPAFFFFLQIYCKEEGLEFLTSNENITSTAFYNSETLILSIQMYAGFFLCVLGF